jgi:hypothetical protein
MSSTLGEITIEDHLYSNHCCIISINIIFGRAAEIRSGK